MAAIDPDVGELLSALLATPLASLAQAAIDSIAAEPRDEDFPFRGRGFDRIHLDRFSRRGQLELAHRVISGRIKREIRMLERMRALGSGLGIERLDLLPPPPGEAAAPRDAVNLMDPGREEALHAFLNVWADVEAELRQRWGAPDAG